MALKLSKSLAKTNRPSLDSPRKPQRPRRSAAANADPRVSPLLPNKSRSRRQNLKKKRRMPKIKLMTRRSKPLRMLRRPRIRPRRKKKRKRRRQRPARRRLLQLSARPKRRKMPK